MQAALHVPESAITNDASRFGALGGQGRNSRIRAPLSCEPPVGMSIPSLLLRSPVFGRYPPFSDVPSAALMSKARSRAYDPGSIQAFRSTLGKPLVRQVKYQMPTGLMTRHHSSMQPGNPGCVPRRWDEKTKSMLVGEARQITRIFNHLVRVHGNAEEFHVLQGWNAPDEVRESSCVVRANIKAMYTV